jgi:hypothetical protein
MSRVSKSCLLVLVVVGLLAVLQLWPTVNVVQGSGGGSVFWNSNEAFVFLGENLYGTHMDAPRYAMEPFLVALGRVHPTEDTICSRMLVIRITNTEIKTYDTNISRDPDDKGCKFSEQVFRGQIYAIGWPAMWRWDGAAFQRPTPEEYGAYATASAEYKTVRPVPWEFDNVEGWSMRDLARTTHDHSIMLGDQSIRLIFHGETSPQLPISLELARSGQSPQTIWSFDGRPHRVSKTDYEKLFRKN